MKEPISKELNEHGTLIAEIIRHLCNNVEFISIKILDKNLNSNVELLIEALNESIKYTPDIIHMSLGTTNLKYWYKLKKIINRLYKSNILLVAAVSNENKRCYPAYFKNVLKVKGCEFKSYKDFFYEKSFFYAPYKFHAQIQKSKNMIGNSLSAAYITGHICNILFRHKYKNIREISNYLKAKGKENYLVFFKNIVKHRRILWLMLQLKWGKLAKFGKEMEEPLSQ